MKKRIARVVVYFGLLCLSVLVVSHPYIWQSIFGPKIKGEPLWAWQQEIRALHGCQHLNSTLRNKLLAFASIDSRPFRWIGYYDSTDPDVLPVLLSLADDRDDGVRSAVADHLGLIPAQAITLSILIRMVEDPVTQREAMISLGRIGPDAKPAIPTLEKCRAEGPDEIRLIAMLALASIESARSR